MLQTDSPELKLKLLRHIILGLTYTWESTVKIVTVDYSLWGGLRKDDADCKILPVENIKKMLEKFWCKVCRKLPATRTEEMKKGSEAEKCLFLDCLNVRHVVDGTALSANKVSSDIVPQRHKTFKDQNMRKITLFWARKDSVRRRQTRSTPDIALTYATLPSLLFSSQK